MRARLLVVSFLAAAAIAQTTTATKAVRFAKLIDGKGHVTNDAVVIVAGDRITAVGSGDAAVPAGAQVIDLRPLTGIPGLIDVHTHMTYFYDANGGRPFAQSGSRLPQVTVFLAQENARKTLETGVTTVRDLGAGDYSDLAMRDLINRGAMPGPRMFVSGYGLHPTSAQFRPGVTLPAGGTADGAVEAMRVVRQNIAAGADVIKIYASTGTGFDVSGRQTYTYDEMRAACEVAHEYGKRVAIHSYGASGARDAVRAGADSLEHAADLDDATLAEMARRGTFYVPTVDHNRYYIDARQLYGYAEKDVATVQDFINRNLETVRRAHQAGVRVAMGSDAVFTMFGQNTRELEQLAKAGLSPAEALATATTNAATLLGMEKDLGCVAAGCYADMVGVEGDPTADVAAVTKGVRWVMKAGAVAVDKRAK